MNNRERLADRRAGQRPGPPDTHLDFTDPRTIPFVPMRSRGELPHLYKDGGSYFVTFRLWDAVVPNAIPVDKKALHKLPALQIAALSEPPLRLGSCVLGRSDLAGIVQDSLQHFHAQRYLLSAWCVMPNHAHAVFTPLVGHDPSDVLHSWKSYTAHKANEILKRQGTFWERESFDHLIRSMEDFEAFVRYVENNPVLAGLCHRTEDWPYSSCGAGVPPA